MINNENSINLSADSLQAPQIQIVWEFLWGPCDVVIDQQALATGCVHWKRTVPYSNVVNCPNYIYRITGKHRGLCIFVIICVIEIDFYCPFQFLIYFYIFFNSRGGYHWQGTASGPKSHVYKYTYIIYYLGQIKSSSDYLQLNPILHMTGKYCQLKARKNGAI